jgi:hypothetical protein
MTSTYDDIHESLKLAIILYVSQLAGIVVHRQIVVCNPKN